MSTENMNPVANLSAEKNKKLFRMFLDDLLVDADILIKKDCSNPELYKMRGNILYYLGVHIKIKNYYKSAIKDYTTAIELDSKYAVAYYNRYLAKCRSNDGERNESALDDFDKALEFGYAGDSQLE